MTLWNCKSSFYHFARNLPLLKRILDDERRNLCALVTLIPSKPERILDIGSGAGSTLDLLPAASFCMATDTSFTMLKKLLQAHVQVAPVCANGLTLPVSNGKFEMVSCIGVSEYVRDKKSLLREIRRALCSGGYFLITIAQPNIFNMMRRLMGHRLHLIRPDRMENMLKEMHVSVIGCRSGLMQNQYMCQVRHPIHFFSQYVA